VGLLDENVIAPPVYVGVRCDENSKSYHPIKSHAMN